MNDKGVTLIELLIVIVVMGIIAGFTIIRVDEIIDNTQTRVDQMNANYLAEVIETGHEDGTLTIKNNKLWNNVSNRGYSGTGSWFYQDMDGYIQNKIEPQHPEAQNSYNWDNGGKRYKFLFSVSGDTVTIFYYNDDREKVELASVTID